MQVRAKLARRPLAHHRSDHSIANYKTTDICSTSFFDKFLHENIGIETAKSVDDGLGGLLRLGQYHANPLSAL